MKREKMSFKNIKNALSRSEMKAITAGSGGGGRCYAIPCGEGNPCFFLMPVSPCACFIVNGAETGTCMSIM